MHVSLTRRCARIIVLVLLSAVQVHNSSLQSASLTCCVREATATANRPQVGGSFQSLTFLWLGATFAGSLKLRG